MKILITGATGLVGQAIQEKLNVENIPFVYLTTSKQKSDGITSFYWQPSAQVLDENAFKDVTHIINLAGASISKPWTKSYKKDILSSRIDSINTLYYFLKQNKHQVKHFIGASAIGIYPNDLNKVYTENESTFNNEFLGEVVQTWEKALQSIEKIYINVSIIRIGVVISNKGGALFQIIKPIKYFVGSFIGNGNQWISWIALEDLANLFIFVIHKNCFGIYNAVSPETTTNKILTLAIAKQLKRCIIFPPIPKILMKLVLGDRHVLLFDSQNVCSSKIKKEGFNFIFSNIDSYIKTIN